MLSVNIITSWQLLTFTSINLNEILDKCNFQIVIKSLDNNFTLITSATFFNVLYVPHCHWFEGKIFAFSQIV